MRQAAYMSNAASMDVREKLCQVHAQTAFKKMSAIHRTLFTGHPRSLDPRAMHGCVGIPFPHQKLRLGGTSPRHAARASQHKQRNVWQSAFASGAFTGSRTSSWRPQLLSSLCRRCVGCRRLWRQPIRQQLAQRVEDLRSVPAPCARKVVSCRMLESHATPSKGGQVLMQYASWRAD